MKPKVRIWRVFSEKGDRLSSFFQCVCVFVCQKVADRTDVTNISSCVPDSLPFTFFITCLQQGVWSGFKLH